MDHVGPAQSEQYRAPNRNTDLVRGRDRISAGRRIADAPPELLARDVDPHVGGSHCARAHDGQAVAEQNQQQQHRQESTCDQDQAFAAAQAQGTGPRAHRPDHQRGDTDRDRNRADGHHQREMVDSRGFLAERRKGGLATIAAGKRQSHRRW